MAENQDDRQREDLSEEPSSYRLEEFRRQGRVAQSRELSGMVGLLACGAALMAFAPRMGSDLLEYMRDLFSADFSMKVDFANGPFLSYIMMKSLKALAWLTLPICIVGFLAGVITSFAQTGSVFSADPLTPDFSRVNPVSGLQRMISAKQLFEAGRLIIRITIVGFVAYMILKRVILGSSGWLLEEPSGLFRAFAQAGKGVFFSLCAVLLVFAGFDYWLQRWEFGKQVRLTKQEAKQEQKEHEGDPLLRARIRTIQRDMARKRMMNAVKKADVIVTNPTHIAIAISYEKEKMQAPKVVAKGADFVAQKIKQIATDAGVPLVENVPLARTLYKTVKVGGLVPRSLYQAVAEVLAYVYRLKNRKL